MTCCFCARAKSQFFQGKFGVRNIRNIAGIAFVPMLWMAFRAAVDLLSGLDVIVGSIIFQPCAQRFSLVNRFRFNRARAQDHPRQSAKDGDGQNGEQDAALFPHRRILPGSRGKSQFENSVGRCGEFRASPQRAVRNEPTRPAGKRAAARRVLRPAFGTIWLSCSLGYSRSSRHSSLWPKNSAPRNFQTGSKNQL